ncbi:MAG: AI-2E family transporter [Acidobacteria bacterium]|nr:AI-2E family transporter [Acidobacteriota bacterium]
MARPDETSRKYTGAFLAGASLVLGWLCLRVLSPFLSAIAWASVLAIVFDRPWRRLRKTLPGRLGFAAALMATAIGLLVALPITFIATLVAGQVIDLASQVSAKLETQHVSSLADIVTLPQVAAWVEQAQDRLGLTREQFEGLAATFAAKATSILGALSRYLVLSVFDGALTFFTTVFLLFFFLRDGADMAEAVLGIVPGDDDVRSALGQSVAGMISAIFRGSLLTAVIQGVSGSVGWWIAGLPSPVLAGAGMGILSLLPLGGTAILWVPGGLLLLFTGSVGHGLFLLLWGSIVTTFAADNILKPALIGRAQELSPLVVFLGVFGGLAAFGFTGLFIGPVALALAASLLDVFRRRAGAASEKKGAPEGAPDLRSSAEV